MDSFSVRNFRCFGDEEQSARLAPVTLLVEDNSTGKTSILALIRALWDIFCDDRVPDFGEPPFHLGGLIISSTTTGVGANGLQVSLLA